MSAIASTRLGTELGRLGPFDAGACMNCGVCTAICPLGSYSLPRLVFRFALLGMRERLLDEQGTIFSCLLCRACEESCPAGVHITENVRLLRRWLLGVPTEVH